MEHATEGRATSPYLLEHPPTSTGRLLLSRAFEHYCALSWGFSGFEIATAFEGGGDAGVRASTLLGARMLGEAIAREPIRTWARAIGGGEPVELRPSAWELDDFAHRFATSAIDPNSPFDPAAVPTHWLFVQMDGWNALLEASLGIEPRRGRRGMKPSATTSATAAPVAAGAIATRPPMETGLPDLDRLIRLPEVKRLTGMSRSTIYRRMDEGRFPRNLPMSGNMAAWRERDVADWLADPR